MESGQDDFVKDISGFGGNPYNDWFILLLLVSSSGYGYRNSDAIQNHVRIALGIGTGKMTRLIQLYDEGYLARAFEGRLSQ